MTGYAWLAELLGGLGLFLYGLELFTSRLRTHAGEGMRRALTGLTRTRWHGLLVGVALTAVLQSSSVVTALTVGLVEAGMMSFAQSLAVVMGANIGTTVTLQLIAFKITDAALWLVFVGAVALLLWRWPRRYLAELLLALGLIFLGLNLMGDAMRPLRDAAWMQQLVGWMDSPWSAALVGAVVTAIIQSSSAFGGMVLALVMQEQVDVMTAIALMLGANIGSCFTAVLAALGKSREAIRVAVFHVLFNVLGAVAVLASLQGFVALVDWMTAFGEFTPSRELANAHTLFNVLVAIALIGFVPWMVRAVSWLVPVDVNAWGQARLVRVDRPQTAVDGLADGWRLLSAMADVVERLRQKGVALPGTLSQMGQADIALAEIRQLYQRLLALMSDTGQLPMTPAQEQQLLLQTRLGNELRTLGQLLGHAIPDAYTGMAGDGLVMGEVTARQYEALQHRVGEQLASLLSAVRRQDAWLADTVRSQKRSMRQLREALELHQGRRLSAQAPDRVSTYLYESLLLDAWMQVSYVTRRAAVLMMRQLQDRSQSDLFSESDSSRT